MSNVSAQLKIAQEILTRYGMTTYLAFGDLGFFLSLLVFCKSSQRQNPCSLYLLSANTCRFVALNVGLIPIIYNLNHQDPSSNSLIFCKLQYYFRHVPNQMMRTFIVLACVDRYALCNTQPLINSFSRYYVAIRLIPIVIISWLLATIFIIVTQTIENGKCGRFDSVVILIYTIYNLITTGLLPPFAMAIFGYLVIANLKQIRSRIKTNTSGSKTEGVLRKRDRALMRLTLIEVIVYLTTTIPYTIVLVYSTITASMNKTSERQKIESFINYLAQSFLLYLNNALPFWVYMASSRAFRLEFKNRVVGWHTTIKVGAIQSIRQN